MTKKTIKKMIGKTNNPMQKMAHGMSNFSRGLFGVKILNKNRRR